MNTPEYRENLPAGAVAEDMRWMDLALSLARRTARRTWPNPPVGAVVVSDGKVVGRGAHEGAGTLHAEPVALAQAGAKARGATLYVTLEPCNHTGRTAPCAPAVYASGISRVVVAHRDPNPTVVGGGCRFLRDRGLDVVCGVRAAAALGLIWPFVVTENFARPYVELKTAHSLDGYFAPPAATRTGQAPVYLTGAAARHDVHLRRRRVDLVLVGEGTVAADNPCLDGRLVSAADDVPQAEPLPGYVDTDLSWAGGFRRDHYLVFAGESARGEARQEARQAAIAADGGEIVYCRTVAGRVDPADLVRRAGERGCLALMVEGGPTLAGAFLRAGTVDRWLRYQAPVVLGGGVGWAPEFLAAGTCDRSFSPTAATRLDADLLTIHDRRCFADALAAVTL